MKDHKRDGIASKRIVSDITCALQGMEERDEVVSRRNRIVGRTVSDF